jgi:hypothetical protein
MTALQFIHFQCRHTENAYTTVQWMLRKFVRTIGDTATLYESHEFQHEIHYNLFQRLRRKRQISVIQHARRIGKLLSIRPYISKYTEQSQTELIWPLPKTDQQPFGEENEAYMRRHQHILKWSIYTASGCQYGYMDRLESAPNPHVTRTRWSWTRR